MKKKIYLVGFMGAGKTFVGKKVAYNLDLPFHDLDNEIEKFAQMSIEEIFLSKGESYFRELESKTLLNSRTISGIIACGGGIIEKKINREYLKKQTVIWLNPSWEVIYQRIKESNRPLVKKLDYKTLKELFLKREQYYREVASFIVENQLVLKTEEIVKSYFF